MELKSDLENMIQTLIDRNESIQNSQDLASIGMNSFLFVKLIVQLEMKFDIEIDDDDMEYENFSSIEQITKFIKTKYR